MELFLGIVVVAVGIAIVAIELKKGNDVSTTKSVIYEGTAVRSEKKDIPSNFQGKYRKPISAYYTTYEVTDFNGNVTYITDTETTDFPIAQGIVKEFVINESTGKVYNKDASAKYVKAGIAYIVMGAALILIHFFPEIFS